MNTLHDFPADRSDDPGSFHTMFGYAIAAAVILGCVFFWGIIVGHNDNAPARIGNDRVPAGLHCQEDEAIVLMGTSTPVCVNVDVLVAGR